ERTDLSRNRSLLGSLSQCYNKEVKLRTMQHKTIHKGVYVVIDPSMEQERIISQLEKIKEGSIAAIQIWNNPKAEITPHLIESILALFKDTNTPVLINNEWEYLKEFDLDGVHFDAFPTDLNQIN